MTTSQKTFIAILIVFSLSSCSKNDIQNSTSDNLDFVVFAQDYPNSFFQINVSEAGEITESNLTSELGLAPNHIPSLTIYPDEDFFIFWEPEVLHFKNFKTNIITSIQSLCDVSFDTVLQYPTFTENKLVLINRAYSNDKYSFITIDKNLDMSTCQNLSLGEGSFVGSLHELRPSSKHVVFKRYKENIKYTYSYNAETNKLDSILDSDLMKPFPDWNLIVDKDKFYSFTNGFYKTYDFEFNLLKEGSYQLDFNGGFIFPIRGSHVEDNKIKVDLIHTTVSGFVSNPNVYDLINRTILVNEEDFITRINNVNGTIKTLETDLKKERLIYGIQLFNSEFQGKILITDFDSNILDEIFINSVPYKIHIL